MIRCAYKYQLSLSINEVIAIHKIVTFKKKLLKKYF